MSELSYYAAQIIDGIANGSIYGLFALSIVLLYRANKLFNFAQTEMATIIAILALFLTKKFSYPVAILMTLAFAFVAGAALHAGIMRFITERRTVLRSNESLVTIGFFTVFNALSAFIYGDEPQPFPSPFGTGISQFLGVGVAHHSLGILAITSLLILGIYFLFEHTKIGLMFEAVAENLTAAKLRGVRASNVLALAWGFTTALSVIGAVLIAPTLFLTPNMLMSIYAYSLIAVVIGGLESPLGAVVGGIVVGVVENLASNFEFIGSELKFVVVAALLVGTLFVKPRGLWGRAEARRV